MGLPLRRVLAALVRVGSHLESLKCKPVDVSEVYRGDAPGVLARRRLTKLSAGLGHMLGEARAHEAMIRDQLTELLSPYGFDAGKDILAITVNRWSHGYSWSYNSLYEDEPGAEATIARAREARGNVAIANPDSDWAPYVPGAVSQAWRAVEEVTAS